jgi:hypothetical protein
MPPYSDTCLLLTVLLLVLLQTTVTVAVAMADIICLNVNVTNWWQLVPVLSSSRPLGHCEPLR